MDVSFILKAVGVLLVALIVGSLLHSKFRLDALLGNKKTDDNVNNNIKEDIKNQAYLEVEEAKREKLKEEKPKDVSVSELLNWLNKKDK